MSIISKPSNKAYLENWERMFGKKTDFVCPRGITNPKGGSPCDGCPHMQALLTKGTVLECLEEAGCHVK